MKVREIAASRSGDKGNDSNVCVFVYRDEDYPLLVERLTAAVVKAKYGELVRGDVERYEVPQLHGLNFLLHDALDGGVSLSLSTDPHGKSYQSLILDIEI